MNLYTSDLYHHRVSVCVPVAHSKIFSEGYHQIWLHQFVKVKVIRHLFNSSPREIVRAIEMNKIKHLTAKPANHRLFVTSANLAVFGESASSGIMTRNCHDSITAKKMEVPEWFTVDYNNSIIIGAT